MADLNMNDRITTLEIARRSANKESALIIECLAMTNELIIDMPNIPCNHGEWHEHILRDTYPKAQLRSYNQGVGEVATQTRVLREGLSEIAIYSVVDARMAKNSGREKEIYSQEATAIIMGMGIQMAEYMIYGSKNRDARCIDGLDVRYRDTADARNVFKFQGTGITPNPSNRCTSLYLCSLGAKALHMLHNAAATGTAGVVREDHGYQDRKMETGGHMPAHVDYFIAQFGLAVEHPDSVKRICNIPTDGSMTEAGRKLLIDMILHAQKLLPPGTGTVAIYGNLAVEELIEKAAREMEIVVHPTSDPWGHPVHLVNGMRVRRVDVIKDSVEYPAEFVA
jgi:hypothetical protein